MALYIIFYHRISALALTALLNGTSAPVTNLTMNQNKKISARVLKVTKATAIGTGHTLYIQDFFYS